MGLIFQLPIGILAVTRLGIVTPEQLSAEPPLRVRDPPDRRHALPGTDPVTMLIEAVPLLVLYEVSVLLARAVGRPPESAVDRDITVSEPPPSGAA